jgi:putative acetyltransferase
VIASIEADARRRAATEPGGSVFTIRDEAPGDRPVVHQVESAAFGQPDEADLVDALREAAHPQLSLVALAAGAQVVGHIFFSPVRVESARPSPPLAGLAPVGVLPAFQGQGAGSALIRAGIERCASIGWQAVFLVGNPAYYGRFGFELAAPLGFHYESPEMTPFLQILELEKGVLSALSGEVRYHDAFYRPGSE